MSRAYRGAAGLLLATAGSLLYASASDATQATVPGCFGAGSALVCNVTAEVRSPLGVRTVDTVVPVCVSVCVDVPVTTVEAGVTGPGEVCVSYTDRAGVQQQRLCRPLLASQPLPTATVPPLPTVTVPPLPTVNPAPVVATASREASEAASTAAAAYDGLVERLEPLVIRIAEGIAEFFSQGCEINHRPIC